MATDLVLHNNLTILIQKTIEIKIPLSLLDQNQGTQIKRMNLRNIQISWHISITAVS